MSIAVESGDEHEALRDDRSDIDENELVPRKCRVRPVHIFIGIACAMTLCGFVLTVYGGVKIYYHDVFKGMTIQSKEIYAKDLSQMYKMFKRIAFFQRKHPEFIDCGHMKATQLKHMDTFDLKKSYINANYDACVEKKLNVIFFPVVSAMLGVLGTLFSMFSVYRGRSGVFVFSAALLAIALAVVMVAIQLVTHNTMDVRVKWSCDYVDGLMPSYECCNMVCSMFVERDPCYATCFNSKFCVDCCDNLCMGVRSAFRVFLAGAIQLMVALFMMLFVVGSSFRTRKSSNQAMTTAPARLANKPTHELPEISTAIQMEQSMQWRRAAPTAQMEQSMWWQRAAPTNQTGQLVQRCTGSLLEVDNLLVHPSCDSMCVWWLHDSIHQEFVYKLRRRG